MNDYRLLSALLSYPSTDLQAAIDSELLPMLEARPDWQNKLMPLLRYLADTDLIDVQERYVATFDRNPNHALHLFEHLHGENRDRGDAMVNLLQEYQAQGFEPQGYELPDYLPLFLEFLSLQAADHAGELLGEAVHVIAYVRDKLQGNDSPYAAVFDLIVAMSPVAPQELKVAPVRDMDEALEVFGPSADGVEPLLQPTLGSEQTIKLYPSRAQAAASMGAKP